MRGVESCSIAAGAIEAGRGETMRGWLALPLPAGIQAARKTGSIAAQTWPCREVEAAVAKITGPFG